MERDTSLAQFITDDDIIVGAGITEFINGADEAHAEIAMELADSIGGNDDSILSEIVIGGMMDGSIAIIGSADPPQHIIDNKNDPLHLPDAIGECAIITGKDEVCGDDETYNFMVQLLPGYDGDISSNEGRRVLINRVKDKLRLNDERAIIASPHFAKIAGGRKSIELLSKFYKVPGPTDVTLLSNINIDLTLRQWERYFSGFFAYNFNMVNFKEHGDTLSTIPIDEVLRNGYTTAACVVNSDTYNNPGKHWMALFVDMRTTPCTIEFFNSSGNPPVCEFTEWMSESKTRLETAGKTALTICVSRVKHQYSRSECGVYSLYYIYARLKGIPYTTFEDTPISDVLMLKFRQHLFWDKRRAPMKTFTLGEYEKDVDVKWE